MTTEQTLIAASLELLAAVENSDEVMVTDEILEAAADYRQLVDELVVIDE